MNQDAERQDRFAFGKNWQSFIASIDDDRIANSTTSLCEMLDVDSLAGKRFLDIGSGSGLSSLAAHHLGQTSRRWTRIRKASSALTHFGIDTPRIRRWHVSQGSVLDESFMESLGRFDVVCAWGVLHHTGDMRRAIAFASQRVADGGLFFLAIYNDQGGASRRWLAVKRLYHRMPSVIRPIWVITIASWYEFKFALARLARGRNPLPLADWRAKRSDRGMSAWHDWVDWVGGLPFEVAKPEEIILPLNKSGFVLENLRTVGSGWGCNEYVFRRL